MQSTSLLPTRGNLSWVDLIRLDIHPDRRNANNLGVYLGFACGANLVIPG